MYKIFCLIFVKRTIGADSFLALEHATYHCPCVKHGNLQGLLRTLLMIDFTRCIDRHEANARQT